MVAKRHTSIYAFLFSAVLVALFALGTNAIAQNPVPFLNQPLVPDATAPGGAGFTLTVNGAGFAATSTVNWNGSPRATTFISKSQLTAAILASDIATASTATVTVVSPSPGGGVSNTQFFSIAVPEAAPSFLPAVNYESGGYIAQSVKIADLRANGKLDIIVADWWGTNNVGVVGVLLGNGDGTFQPAVTYNTGGAPNYSLVVADVNGDGKLDLIISSCSASSSTCGTADGVVSVLLGNGDGTFQPMLSFSSGAPAGAHVAVADVNGDGKRDLIVTNLLGEANGDGTAAVLLGNGDGTFKPPVLYDSGVPGANVVAVADINGDGILDLLVADGCYYYCYGGGVITRLSVLLGNGDGTFQPAITYPTGGNNSGWVSVADVNGDGKPDAILGNSNLFIANGTGSVLLNVGSGTFEAPVTYDSGGYAAVELTLADVTADGHLDIIVDDCGPVGGCGTGVVGILLGRGDGTFDPVIPFSSGVYNATAIAVADLNGDGRLDLVAANQCAADTCNIGSVSVLLNASGPAATTTTTLASSANPQNTNEPVTYTATVTTQQGGAATGTITFQDGGVTFATVTLSGNQASYKTSYPTAAIHSITASYSGDANNSGSTSPALSEKIWAFTTTALTTSGSPSPAGQPITFTATVTSRLGAIPNGETVTFYDNDIAIGTATTNNGVALFVTSSLSLDNHTIKATYAGDTSFEPSTSQELEQLVEHYPTTTTLASNPNPSIDGQSVTLTATVTSTAPGGPTGSVTFYNGSGSLGWADLVAGSATRSMENLPVGTDTITAQYNGDALSAKSTSAAIAQVVSPPELTTTSLVSSLNPSTYGDGTTFTATVSSSGPIPPTGTVLFGDPENFARATLNNGMATGYRSGRQDAGTYTVQAKYLGTTSSAGSESPQLIQVVLPAPTTTTITSSPNPSVKGQGVTFTATVTYPAGAVLSPQGNVTFTAGTTVLGTRGVGHAVLTVGTLPVGTSVVTATYSGSTDFFSSSASLTQTVQQ